MKELTFSDIPYDWAVCCQTGCPLAAQCLRHHAAQLMPADMLEHNVILPAARQASTCRAFVADEPSTMAYGMKHLYDGLKPWEATSLRKSVQDIFGSQRQYYRYREGLYPITPKQQALVAEVFRADGRIAAPRFDRTEVVYHFPTVAI